MIDQKRWLTHYPKEIPANISYDEKPLHAYLIESAKLYNEKKALPFMGKEMSFKEI